MDGRTGMMAPDDGTTLRDLFETLRQGAVSRRRAVVALTLDGELLTPERQDILAGRKPGEFDLLEVRTADPVQFSLATIDGLQAHLQNMVKTHQDVTAAVTAGEYGKTLDKGDACFQGWDILLRAVRDVGFICGADFKKIDAGGRTMDLRIRQLQDVLLRFSSCLEFKDVARVAEIVDHELRLRLEDWKAVTDALRLHVNRQGGRS